VGVEIASGLQRRGAQNSVLRALARLHRTRRVGDTDASHALAAETRRAGRTAPAALLHGLQSLKRFALLLPRPNALLGGFAVLLARGSLAAVGVEIASGLQNLRRFALLLPRPNALAQGGAIFLAQRSPAAVLIEIATAGLDVLLLEKHQRLITWLALTLVGATARLHVLLVLQVALDELASVRRPAVEVVQVAVVGAEVRVACDLRFRAPCHHAVTSILRELEELKVRELLVSCQALGVKLFSLDGPFHDGVRPGVVGVNPTAVSSNPSRHFVVHVAAAGPGEGHADLAARVMNPCLGPRALNSGRDGPHDEKRGQHVCVDSGGTP